MSLVPKPAGNPEQPRDGDRRGKAVEVEVASLCTWDPSTEADLGPLYSSVTIGIIRRHRSFPPYQCEAKRP